MVVQVVPLYSSAWPVLMMASITPRRALLMAVTPVLIWVGGLVTPAEYCSRLPLVSNRSTSVLPLANVPTVTCLTPDAARTVVLLLDSCQTSPSPVVSTIPAMPNCPALTEATPLDLIRCTPVEV